jgi:manganese transport protein
MTRGLAIVPAAIITIWYGEAGTAKLLILSQVVLGLALPFAIVPLVMFTANRRKMGALVAPRWMTVLAAIIATTLIVLNVKLLWDLVTAL